MQHFDGISFLWAIALLTGVAILYGLRAVIGYNRVAKDAAAEYDYRMGKGMIDDRISRSGYLRAYKRHHNPRSLAYVAGTIAAILLLTAPALAIVQFVLEQFWIFMGRSRVFEPGFLVWQFFIFFAIIGIWAVIAYAGARHYHRGTSISMRDEILKEIAREE